MIKQKTSLPQIIDSKIKSGDHLAGNDFSIDDIKIWFNQEKEAYYVQDSGQNLVEDRWYEYARYLNHKVGFDKLTFDENDNFSVLVIGPGPGKEIEKFSKKYKNAKLHFIESSENYKNELRIAFPNSVVLDANIDASINLKSNSINLIVAFSVLHHIPNITKCLGELYRVLKDDGIMFLREPCSSMGDWRGPRSATPNERGISKKWFLKEFDKLNLRVFTKPVPVLFDQLNKIIVKSFFGKFMSNYMIYVLDRIISKIVSVNNHYWRDSFFKKIGPSAYFYHLRK